MRCFSPVVFLREGYIAGNEETPPVYDVNPDHGSHLHNEMLRHNNSEAIVAS